MRIVEDSLKDKTPHEQESIQRQIAVTDKQIDQLVYDWGDSGKAVRRHNSTGLTAGEIQIVWAGK